MVFVWFWFRCPGNNKSYRIHLGSQRAYSSLGNAAMNDQQVVTQLKFPPKGLFWGHMVEKGCCCLGLLILFDMCLMVVFVYLGVGLSAQQKPLARFACCSDPKPPLDLLAILTPLAVRKPHPHPRRKYKLTGPCGKVDGPGKWNKIHLNQCRLFWSKVT